jgi:hypothetical protein
LKEKMENGKGKAKGQMAQLNGAGGCWVADDDLLRPGWNGMSWAGAPESHLRTLARGSDDDNDKQPTVSRSSTQTEEDKARQGKVREFFHIKMGFAGIPKATTQGEQRDGERSLSPSRLASSHAQGTDSQGPVLEIRLYHAANSKQPRCVAVESAG